MADEKFPCNGWWEIPMRHDIGDLREVDILVGFGGQQTNLNLYEGMCNKMVLTKLQYRVNVTAGAMDWFDISY